MIKNENRKCKAQRFEAMKQLGYDEIEASVVNIPDQNKEKALNLRLNKLSGEWDNVKLNDVIQEFNDIDQFSNKISEEIIGEKK